MAADATTAALAGVRVLDFTWVGAGPFLTKPLADHGADVIKVESRTRTDPIRSMKPFKDGVAGVDRSGYFANRNSSKRSICLDLKQPRGRDLALDLMEHCDVVVNNFSAGTMDRLGLGYDTARTRRPDVIYLEMPMQGTTGPHRDYRGYGLTIAALSGFLAASGWPDRLPVGTGTNYPDHVPNPLHATVAVLSALRHRRRTGEGVYVELSQLESTINVLASALLEEQLTDGGFRRQGNADPVAAPHGVYPCTGDDRWIAVAVGDDDGWRGLMQALPGLLEAAAERWDGAEARHRDHAQVDAVLAALTATWDRDELVTRLQAAGVVAAPVQDARDVLTDPQLRHRRHWIYLDHPEMGSSVYDASPYRLSRTPGKLSGPAPLLGADTADVLRDVLGISADELSRLQREGVAG